MSTRSQRAETVLIIDDEVDIREMIELTLSHDGYEVVTAEGGEHALEIASERDLDLVITDIKMPGMDGIEIIRSLRDRFPQLAIIVVTGYLTPETIAACTRLGAEELIRKPFLIHELERAIARHLEPAGD